MATVTGKTSEKIDQLLNGGLVSAQLNNEGQLTLITRGGATINAGSVGSTIVGAAITAAGRLIFTRRNGQTLDAGSVSSIKPIDAWPVGSIFMSASSANPSAALGGGTWVAWGSGRVPLGVDTGDTDFSSVEKLGGEKSVALNEAQLPAHDHTMLHTHPMPHTHEPAYEGDRFIVNRPGLAGNRANGTSWHATTNVQTGPSSAPDTQGASTGVTGSKGGGAPHNNLQPFITCYMWKRTA